jgi:hypothetical protein
VSAITKTGKTYKLKYKIVDENKILILNRDSIGLKVRVTPKADPKEQKWYPIMQKLARFAMMLRSANVSYSNHYAMSLPGFSPNVGDMLGQGGGSGGLKPGLDFAFGLVGDSYIDRANQRGWLINNDSVSTPATTNLSEDLQLKVMLEPFTDFKIDLNASRSVDQSQKHTIHVCRIACHANRQLQHDHHCHTFRLPGPGQCQQRLQKRHLQRSSWAISTPISVAWRPSMQVPSMYPKASTLAGKTVRRPPTARWTNTPPT